MPIRPAGLRYIRAVSAASFLSSPVALALVTSLLLGLAMIVAQRGLRSLPTLPGAAVANTSAALLFWALAPLFWSDADATPWSFGVFVLVGLFFPGGVTLLMLEGNRRLGPSITASIAGTTPLFAYLAAVAFLGEALVMQGLLGTAAIVFGIAALAWRRGGMPGQVASSALWFPLGSSVVRAVAQIMIKYGLTLWPSPYSAIVIAYTASAAMVWTLLRLRGERVPRCAALGWFVASGLMNGVGTLAMYAAFRHGEVTIVAPIVATGPLVTLVASAIFLREEKLTLRLVAGVLITLSGVGLILVR